MIRLNSLPYLPTMFASCMVFQVVYVLCIALWALMPDLAGHAVLTVLFPQFRLLDLPSFVYGLVASAVYGWFVAVVFVFFFNLWARLVALVTGGKTEQPQSSACCS